MGPIEGGQIAETLPAAGLRFFRHNQTNPSGFGSTRLAGSITRYRTNELLPNIRKESKCSRGEGKISLQDL